MYTFTSSRFSSHWWECQKAGVHCHALIHASAAAQGGEPVTLSKHPAGDLRVHTRGARAAARDRRYVTGVPLVRRDVPPPPISPPPFVPPDRRCRHQRPPQVVPPRAITHVAFHKRPRIGHLPDGHCPAVWPAAARGRAQQPPPMHPRVIVGRLGARRTVAHCPVADTAVSSVVTANLRTTDAHGFSGGSGGQAGQVCPRRRRAGPCGQHQRYKRAFPPQLLPLSEAVTKALGVVAMEAAAGKCLQQQPPSECPGGRVVPNGKQTCG